jgi:hypothetical protein
VPVHREGQPAAEGVRDVLAREGLEDQLQLVLQIEGHRRHQSGKRLP